VGKNRIFSGSISLEFTGILVAFFMLLTGCGSLKNLETIDAACEAGPSVEGAASVSLFLTVRRPSVKSAKVRIANIELLVDDSWVPMSSSGVIEISSADKEYIQKFLGRQWLSGHYCRGVRFNVVDAVLLRTAGDKELLVADPRQEIMLNSAVELEVGSRKVLSLEWDPEKGFSEAGFDGMLLKLSSGGADRVSTNLLYVTCPDIDTVYVVSVDSYQVVDAFPAEGVPTCLAVDSISKKIYTLSSSIGKIIPYDISTYVSSGAIQIPLVASPVFMTVNNRTETAYVLDEQGVLTSIDLVSGNMLYRNRIGSRPIYLYYVPVFEKLAVSSVIDQTIYLVNPETLLVEDSVVLGSAPSGLVNKENYLYIAQPSTNSVSVYDLNARKLLKNIQVGFEPTRFVTAGDFVYGTNFVDGTISVIQSGQLSVSKEIAVGKSVREMVVSEKRRLLFVGTGGCEGSLAVIDTTGNRLIGHVELGAKPSGIAVVE